MKNIHLLPTDRSSRVSIKNDVLVLHRQQYRLGTQNIYITSDEEIKEGDWCFLNKDGREFVYKCTEKPQNPKHWGFKICLSHT